jgi:iron complex transport system permease protein
MAEARVRMAATDKEKANSVSRYCTVVTLAAIALVIVLIAALSVGRYAVSFSVTIRVLLSKLYPIAQTWDNKTDAVIMILRLPRSVAAILIGSALALSGACYQSIFKNPMVSPDLLGVSSGACVGAAIAILMGFGSLYIQLFAFLGGIGTVFLTTLIPRLIRNESTTILVLSGVIMSSLMSSVMSIIKSLADTDTQLAEITYWMMGSLASVQFSDIIPVLPTLIIPTVVILIMRFRLNVMSLGDREAKTLGINLQRTRNLFVICATLLTASCVCLAGTIGWIGLVIPHISRLIVGADNKKMLPVAMLFGSTFMLLIDILCRTLSSAELKIGILTGIVGAPFFFFILLKQNKTIM